LDGTERREVAMRFLKHKQPDEPDTEACPRCHAAVTTDNELCPSCGWDLGEAYHDPDAATAGAHVEAPGGAGTV
jgi:predicted amidophosphoribosyltransferase